MTSACINKEKSGDSTAADELREEISRLWFILLANDILYNPRGALSRVGTAANTNGRDENGNAEGKKKFGIGLS